jgi:NAD(P)-dependent dehydrogenase (short-subunit alcohol dehydrogenase family)
MMSSTSEQERLSGRTVLVTGGTGGIGYQTARALARRGARLVITGRDADAGERAAAAIRRDSGQGSVSFLPADHATVAGNRQLAEQIRVNFPDLNVLVNNVGELYGTRWETADGYETTLAMNFLGPFTLTYELLSLLQANAPARCINVVSAAFRMCKGDPFQDLQSTRRFVSGDAYARAKLLNVLFSLAMARWITAEQVTVNLIHPGTAWTQMTRSTTSQTIPAFRFAWPLLRLRQRIGSPEQAGRRVAALVASPQAGAATGQYFEAGLTAKRLSGPEVDPQYQRRAWLLGSQLQAGAAKPSTVIAAGGG